MALGDFSNTLNGNAVGLWIGRGSPVVPKPPHRPKPIRVNSRSVSPRRPSTKDRLNQLSGLTMVRTKGAKV